MSRPKTNNIQIYVNPHLREEAQLISLWTQLAAMGARRQDMFRRFLVLGMRKAIQAGDVPEEMLDILNNPVLPDPKAPKRPVGRPRLDGKPPVQRKGLYDYENIDPALVPERKRPVRQEVADSQLPQGAQERESPAPVETRAEPETAAAPMEDRVDVSAAPAVPLTEVVADKPALEPALQAGEEQVERPADEAIERPPEPPPRPRLRIGNLM